MKNKIWLILLLTAIVSCKENEPTYSIIPHIEFKDILFEDVENNPTDGLVLSFYFRDGDFDLGLNWDELHEYPYNRYNYFLEAGEGKLDTVPTIVRYTNLPPFIDASNNTNKGKLVTVRTRKKPGYEYLPPYSNSECNYMFDSLCVLDEDATIIDASYNITDSLKGINNQPDVFILRDTLYTVLNPNFFNIEVDFLVKEDQDFVEFDFNSISCDNSFDGIFPLITGAKAGKQIKSGPFTIKVLSPTYGILSYEMRSSGFKFLFSNKTLKLRIKIRDRALHESNVIETPEFTLDEI